MPQKFSRITEAGTIDRNTKMTLRTKTRAFILVTTLIVMIGLQGCKKNLRDANVPVLQVSSPNFADGGDIPKQFTCDESNTSPALSWSTAPAKTRSLALIAS